MREQRVRVPQPAQRRRHRAALALLGLPSLRWQPILMAVQGPQEQGNDKHGRGGQRGTLLRATLGTFRAMFVDNFKSGPVRIGVRQRA